MKAQGPKLNWKAIRTMGVVPGKSMTCQVGRQAPKNTWSQGTPKRVKDGSR